MKRIFLLFVVLIISGLLHNSMAQQLTFANTDKSFKRMYSKVIGQNEQGYFILKSNYPFNNKQNQLRLRDNNIAISLLNKNLSLVWNLNVQLPDPSADIQDIQFLSDSLFLFYTSINKVNSSSDLYAIKLDIKKGELNAAPTKLVSIAFDRKSNRGVYYIQQSKNGKLFSTMYKQPAGENDKMAIDVHVFQSDLNLVWHQNYPTEFFDGVLLLNDFKLGNDSALYFLTSLDLAKKTLRNRNFNLSIASPQSATLLNIPINQDKLFLNDLHMEIDELNGKLVFAGFYSEMNSTSSAGIFTATFLVDSQKFSKNTESFKAKFLNEFVAERTVNRGTELINYFIDRLVLRSDGGVILVAESNYVTESTNYNSYYQMYTTSYTYHYDNVLLFSIQPNGKIDWEQIIRKNQVSDDDAAFYSSYTMAVDADRIYFVYNKSIKKASELAAFSVSNKGLSDEKIIAKENENILLMPAGAKQIAADQLLVPCLVKSKLNLVRVSF